MRYAAMLVVSAVSIAATGVTASAQYIQPFPMLQAEQAAGQKIFSDHCAVCHAQKKFGPSLQGVVGRKAGSLANFPYSDALKNSGLVWSEDNLRKWITNNTQTVPNTLMRHVSISDPAEQIYLIAYLKSLTPSKAP